MNIHPIVVHFPIALLTLYSVVELIKSKNIVLKYNLFYSKALLLITGTVGGYFALQTGDIASHLLKSRSSILRFHEMFAQMSIMLYSFLSLGYILKLIEPYLEKRNFKYIEAVRVVTTIILSPIVSISVAIIALTTLSITGGLGGILVYGPNADFVTKILYSIFNIQ